jgi:hypothetical protein
VRITIDLPADLADQLTREAAEAGLPLPEHAIHLLANRSATITQVPPLTGTELIEYWNSEGVIGSRSDIDDPGAFSRRLRTLNENRVRGLTGS